MIIRKVTDEERERSLMVEAPEDCNVRIIMKGEYCSVEFFGPLCGFLIQGLTPENAVELKKAVRDAFVSGQLSYREFVGRAMGTAEREDGARRRILMARGSEPEPQSSSV